MTSKTKKHHLGAVNLKRILSNTGIILCVPGFMSLASTVIALVFHETYAIIPFFFIGICSILIGLGMHRLFKVTSEPTLWDSMAIAALSWLICPLIAALVIYWICTLEVRYGIKLESVIDLTRPINSIFEAFSGFTSTGLTLVSRPSEYSNSILWWRSLMQWVGGVGLIVFVLLVVNGAGNRYNLYYAESRTETIGKNLKQTIKRIWILYLGLTIFSIILFKVAGMPTWEAINHGMATISTGGFGMKDDSFASYNQMIKIAAIFIMFLGSISFIVHYQIYRYGRLSLIWKSLPHRFLLLALIIGPGIMLYLDRYSGGNWSYVDTVFTWISTMSTTGYSVVDISTHTTAIKIVLIFAMILGGCAGSTAGGFKIQRVMNLFASLHIRLKSIMEITRRKEIKNLNKTAEEPGLILPDPEQTRKLFASGTLFFLWMISLFVGALLIATRVPDTKGFNVIFESLSALSNVGMSTNVVAPTLATFDLAIFSFLMWIGKVEIIPAIVLFLSFLERIYQPKG